MADVNKQPETKTEPVEQSKTVVPKRGEDVYYYPAEGISVVATSREEADEKLAKQLDLKKEQDNG